MVALVIVLICSFSSDLLKERPKHIMTMAGIATVALTIVAAVENNKARYAFLAIGRELLTEDLQPRHMTNNKVRGVWCLGMQHTDTKLSFQHDLPTGRETSRCNWPCKVWMLLFRHIWCIV